MALRYLLPKPDANASAAPEVNNLPIAMAVIEIIEYLVFMQHEAADRTKCYRQEMALQVRVKMEKSEGDNNHASWFHIKVCAHSLDPEKVKMDAFLKSYCRNLVASTNCMQEIFDGKHLTQEVPLSAEPAATLIIQYHVTKKGLVDTVESKEKPKATNGVSILFRVYQDVHHMSAECQVVYNYLYRLRITHPEKPLKYNLDCQGSKSSSLFGNSYPRAAIGQRKLAAHTEHYIGCRSSDTDSSPGIKPLCGSTFYLPFVGGLAGRQVRISAAAATAPPADDQLEPHLCDQIQVFAYGPGDLPLFLPGMTSGAVNPTILLKLEDFGLRVAEKLSPSADKGVVQPDWSYKLCPVDTSGSAQNSENTTEEGDTESTGTKTYHLQIFLYFSQPPSKASNATFDQIDFVADLREDLTQILYRSRNKVRKTLHSALGRLLQNYSIASQRQDLLSTAIPSITHSVMSVIKRSTNTAFRQRCQELFQKSDSSQLSIAVQKSLWNVASNKFGVSEPPSLAEISDSQSSGKSLPGDTLPRPAATDGNSQDRQGSDTGSQNMQWTGAHPDSQMISEDASFNFLDDVSFSDSFLEDIASTDDVTMGTDPTMCGAVADHVAMDSSNLPPLVDDGTLANVEMALEMLDREVESQRLSQQQQQGKVATGDDQEFAWIQDLMWEK